MRRHRHGTEALADISESPWEEAPAVTLFSSCGVPAGPVSTGGGGVDRAGPGVVRGCPGSSGLDRMGPGACWVNSTGKEGRKQRWGERERSRKGGRESRRQEKEGEEEEEKEIRDGEGEEGGREIRT